jgi:hypothetical protein
MTFLLALLILAILLGLGGFAVHVLWYIALACLVVWLVGTFTGAGRGRGAP